MGIKESKQFPISSEEAYKRGKIFHIFSCQSTCHLWSNFNLDDFLVTEAEKRRLQDAFRRLTPSTGLISKPIFIREVIGDGIPLTLAEQIYNLCNGGLHNNSNGHGGSLTSSKGLNFREVLTFLVLITRGSKEEKIKCKWLIFLSFLWQINMKFGRGKPVCNSH